MCGSAPSGSGTIGEFFREKEEKSRIPNNASAVTSCGPKVEAGAAVELAGKEFPRFSASETARLAAVSLRLMTNEFAAGCVTWSRPAGLRAVRTKLLPEARMAEPAQRIGRCRERSAGASAEETSGSQQPKHTKTDKRCRARLGHGAGNKKIIQHDVEVGRGAGDRRDDR